MWLDGNGVRWEVDDEGVLIFEGRDGWQVPRSQEVLHLGLNSAPEEVLDDLEDTLERQAEDEELGREAIDAQIERDEAQAAAADLYAERQVADALTEAEVAEAFERQQLDRAETEAQDESDLRSDFQTEEREHEQDTGYSFTREQRENLWGEYHLARRRDPSTTFEEVRDRTFGGPPPDTIGDRFARREQLAAHMQDADDEAELAEAGAEEPEETKVDLSDPRARRAAMADALAEEGAVGISKREAEALVAERGGHVEKLPQRDARTGAEVYQFVAEEEDAA
jgi:hypothetical protein